jgi:hypothetical protein
MSRAVGTLKDISGLKYMIERDCTMGYLWQKDGL